MHQREAVISCAAVSSVGSTNIMPSAADSVESDNATNSTMNKFVSDGSFMSQFLKATNTSTLNLSKDESRSRRKFSEVPNADPTPSPTNDTNQNETNESDGPELPTASDLQYEALKHLNPFDEIKKKDTYEELEEYGGTIDGGTWEHRKRAKEMIGTANLADVINKMNASKKRTKSYGLSRHIPDELLKEFETRCMASNEATDSSPDKVDVLTSLQKKIGPSNVGYQMLQKEGWKEGEGVGVGGTGRVDVIQAKEKTALGQPSTDVTSEDDSFEQYRKRMMLAYRFRPNPLNNPRRSYDGYKTIYDSTHRTDVMDAVNKIQKDRNYSGES